MHAFDAPIHAERPTVTDLGRTFHCTCPRSPFCRGANSADWATCVTGCKACDPRARRRRNPPPIVRDDPSSAEVDHAE